MGGVGGGGYMGRIEGLWIYKVGVGDLGDILWFPNVRLLRTIVVIIAVMTCYLSPLVTCSRVVAGNYILSCTSPSFTLL